MLEYVEVCQRAGVGASGTMTKIERLKMGVLYLKLWRLEARDHAGMAELQVIEERLAKWKTSLRPSLKMRRVERMEEEEPLNPDTIKEVALHKGVWAHFARVVQTAKRGGEVEDRDLSLCTTAAAMALLYHCAQRSGAAAGLTREEWAERRREEAFESVRVKKHKTGVHGVATLTIPKEEARKVELYHRHIRPLMDPGDDIPNLLVYPGPAPVTHLSMHLKRLGEKYKIALPTPTQVRKAVASKAAQVCTESQVAALSASMTLSTDTQKTLPQYPRPTEGNLWSDADDIWGAQTWQTQFFVQRRRKHQNRI